MLHPSLRRQLQQRRPTHWRPRDVLCHPKQLNLVQQPTITHLSCQKNPHPKGKAGHSRHTPVGTLFVAAVATQHTSPNPHTYKSEPVAACVASNSAGDPRACMLIPPSCPYNLDRSTLQQAAGCILHTCLVARPSAPHRKQARPCALALDLLY